MAKSDVVLAAVASIQLAQVQALSDGLGSVYDQGANDQKASDGSFKQEDIDAAVKAAQSVDADALAKAQADAQIKLDALQAQMDSVSSKEAVDEKLIGDLQSSLSAAQASIAAVFALFPVPAPAPAPVPQA